MTYKHVLKADAKFRKLFFRAEMKQAQQKGLNKTLRKYNCVKCRVPFLRKSFGRMGPKFAKNTLCPCCCYEEKGFFPPLGRYYTEYEESDQRRLLEVQGVKITETEESRKLKRRVRLKRLKLKRLLAEEKTKNIKK